MTKTRRLADLYVVGRTVDFDDGEGDPISIYLRKLTPLELEGVLRKANARRAAYIAALRDEESQEYQEVYSANIERLADRDACLDVVIEEDLLSRYISVEAELAAEEEWSKDDYLQGLRDRWTETLEDEDRDEDEFERVSAELKRFNDQVNEAFETIKLSLKKEYTGVSGEDLCQKALKVLLKTRSDNAWLTEVRLEEVLLATRVSKEKPLVQYFESRDELKSLPAEILNRLLTEYAELLVPSVEGKD